VKTINISTSYLIKLSKTNIEEIKYIDVGHLITHEQVTIVPIEEASNIYRFHIIGR